MISTHRLLVWLRSAMLSRAVAAAFLLAIGLAQASAVLRPQSIELLCSAGSAMKLLIKSSDGDAQDSGTHTVHCGLCALGDGTPPAAWLASTLALAQAQPQLPFISALVARAAPPLPARGPPAFS